MSGASEDERPLKFSRRAKRSITNKKVVEEDRISSLPDRLLIHILSFLSDTKQVARTCVLSKRWEYVWTNLLEVGLRQFSKNIAEVSKFVDVVGRLLAMRKNLNKLTLGFSYDKRIDSNLNLLIYHAVKNKVKDINFTACGSKSYELPELFYSNSSLTNLTLRGCVLAPRGIVSWGSLKTLSIGPRITNSSMEKVLLGCPVLEVLRLNNREGLDSLNISSTNLTTLEIHETSFPIKDVVLDISAPYLRVLSICNYNSSLKFRLRNVQSVVQARLDIDCGCCEMGKRKNYMKELLEKLQSIEKLDLGPQCIKTVNCMMTEEIPLFTKLRCLTLKDNCDYAALAMLRRSPNLETLHIRRDWTSPMQQGEDDNEDDYFDWEDVDKNAYSIKTLKITDFTVQDLTSPTMLFFIKLRLLRTPALKEMIITVKKNDSRHKYASSKLAKRLLTIPTFPRASSEAVFVFK